MSGLTYETIDPKKRTIIMTGLAIALFTACFDGTVTTTCGPIIASKFNATDLLPWLTTAYLLLETVTIPLSGKLSDLYGRKKLLIAGLTLFGFASFLAGIAWDMWVVILARGFQGAGGGILIPVATAAVSDLYAPEDRGKIQGVLGALYGVGMGAGPLIGGAFASLDPILGLDGWHYAFLINLVIVLIVYGMCKGEFPSFETDAKPNIDYKGIAAVSMTLMSVVVYFQCVGSVFPIISIPSVAFILVIIILFRTFTYIETKAAEPVIAPHVFENPTVRAAAIILFLLGFAMVGDELFTGMYLQRITGHSAVGAGLFIIVMVIGMMTTSIIGGLLLNRTGVKPWIVAGTLCVGFGLFLFQYIEVEFNPVLFSAAEFVFGSGAGCLLASLMTAVQSSCDHSEVGMTTSAVNLMRNVGSTIGTSIFTLVVNAVIYKEALGNPLTETLADKGLGILDCLKTAPADVAAAIKQVFTDSVATAFGFGALALLIAVVVGFRFKVVKVSQTKDIMEYSDNLTKDNPKY